MHLIEHTAAWFGITPAEIVGTCREKRLVTPRHVCVYVMSRRTRLSFPQIGRAMKRDHSTMVHAYRKIWRAIEHDVAIAAAVEHLMQVEIDRFRPAHFRAVTVPVERPSLEMVTALRYEPPVAETILRPVYNGRARNDFDSSDDHNSLEYRRRVDIRKGSEALLAALRAV